MTKTPQRSHFPILRHLQYGAVVALPALIALGRRPADVALGVGLLAWGAQLLQARRLPRLHRNPLTPLLIAWFVVAVCSMRNSIDPAASLHGLGKLLKAAGLYFLVLSAVETRDALRGVIAGWAIGLALMVGDALWQMASGRDLVYGHAVAYTLETIWRLTATFKHPEDFSIYLVSVCPVAVALAVRGPCRWRGGLWVLVGLTFPVLFLTWARGSVLAFLAEMLVLAFMLWHWAPAVLSALMAGVGFLLVSPSVKVWAATMPSMLHQLTEPERLMYWQAALNMVRAHPIIGVGVNTFVKAYSHYRIASDHFTGIGPYAHNQYLQLAAELGLVGLSVFLWLLIRVFRTAVWRGAGRRGATSEAIVGAGLAAGLIGYLITGCLESALFYGRTSMIFWTLIGLCLAIDRLAHSSDVDTTRL